MTSHNHPTGRPRTAWHTYLAATDAARDQYLATTYAAHRQYLTGPWPDRDAYNAVELSAWMTYYQASRTAWQHYSAALTCPCCTSGGDDCTCHSDCGVPRCQMADPPRPAQEIEIPVYPSDTRTDEQARMPRRPTYTPNQEGTELWRSN